MTEDEQKQLDGFIDLAREAGAYACDVEHPPTLSPHNPGFRLAGCGFGTTGRLMYLQTVEKIRYVCDALFSREEVDCVGHNFKYDLICLQKADVIGKYGLPVSVIDTMVAMNMLEDNRRPNQLGLKTLIKELRGIEMVDFKTAWGFGERSAEFRDYALDDVRQEYWLWNYVKPLLIEQGLDRPFRKIVCEAIKVFTDIEVEGIGWSLSGARKLLAGFVRLRDTMEREIKGEIGELNLNSGDQLAKRLFEDLKISSRGIKSTPSGKRLAVDADAMDILAARHPICAKIKTFRTADKMISTYIEPLSRMAMEDPKGRIHPTYWLVSSTGRTRSEKPNFQNIPAHLAQEFSELNIRKNVISAPGRTMIVADLSQIELRLCAHTTRDKMLLKAYREWQCTACGGSGTADTILHKCPECGCNESEDILKFCPTCKTKHVKPDKKTGRCKVCDGAAFADVMEYGFWHGLDLHTQTTDAIPALKGDRQNGKVANFALIYCATARRMHIEHPSLSVGQWQDIIDQFFRVYVGVREWHLRMERMLYEEGQCRDMFGRLRRIPRDDISHNPKHALNQIVNFPIQAAACEYTELCLAEIRRRFIESGRWLNGIWPVNFVHDELDFECNDELQDECVPVIQDVLENRVKFALPIRTSISIAKSWGDAK